MKSHLALVTAFGLTLTGCGQVEKMTSGKTQTTQDPTLAAGLTDAANQAAADAATAAASNDAATTSTTAAPTTPSTTPPPATGGALTLKGVIDLARAYTLKLLGISDAPLKEFLATVQAARALATSVDEFKQQVADARKKLDDALAAQKAAADKARTDHADELAKIFDATKNAFLQCRLDVALEKCHGKGPVGPAAFIGDGSFRGSIDEMHAQLDRHGGHGQNLRGHDGPRDARLDDAGPAGEDDKSGQKAESSAECQKALTDLKALVSQ